LTDYKACFFQIGQGQNHFECETFVNCFLESWSVIGFVWVPWRKRLDG